MVKCMVMDDLKQRMDVSMKENGITIYRMGLELKLGMTAQTIQVNGKWERRTGKESLPGQISQNMMENLKKIIWNIWVLNP